VVNGTNVPTTVVTADLAAEVAAGKKGRAQTDPSSPLASPKARAGGYTPEAKAAALTNRILDQLYTQELRSNGVKVVAVDKQRARQSLCSDAKTGQPPAGTSCPPLAAYPAAYRAFQLSLRERELAFAKLLYGRVFDKVQTSQPAVLREICLNIVQVATEAVSTEVQQKMKAGASMADASKAEATAGKASSVQPGCLFAAVAPANLANAKVGAVEPVKGESVLGVAQVTSFKTATKADFATQPPSSVAAVQTLLKAEVDRSIRRAKVTVDRSYGRWDPAQLVVVAPKAKTTTTTAPASTAPASTAPASTAPASATTRSTGAPSPTTTAAP
jgi:hypothetical protein